MSSTPTNNAHQVARNLGYEGTFNPGEAAAWLAANPTANAQYQNIIQGQAAQGNANWASTPLSTPPVQPSPVTTTSTPTTPTTPTTQPTPNGLTPEEQRATDIGRSMGLLSATETATGGLLGQRLNAAGEQVKQDYINRYNGGSPATGPMTINEYMANNVQNPTLPNNTQFVPQTMSVQQGELLDSTGYTINNSGIPSATPVTANQMQVAQADTSQLYVDPQTGQQYLLNTPSGYTATTTSELGGTAQMQAAQGQVSELSTLVGQLTKLYDETEDGVIANWAQGAVRVATDAMAARGLGNSSIGVGAITEAIQQSAINIAAADAATYFQMDMQNLANDQQARLVNVQNRQQSLLSDQSAINAAKQFSAASAQQISMFQAQLVTDITTQNANRVAAMEQFNAAEANKMELSQTQIDLQTDVFNEQQRLAVEQYNSTMDFQVQKFNTEMAAAIEQSNANWRRQINTGNTATINAANQLNVQNAFNMSAYSVNALWQSLRDEASWAFTASQSQAQRDFNLALAALQHEYALIQNTQTANFQAEQAEGEGTGSLLAQFLEMIS